MRRQKLDKLKMETKNLTEKNIEKIATLFPNVITEMKDENGKLKKGINFELLKQELSGDVIEGEECYDFTWVGKKAAIVESNTPIRKTLRPCIEESKNWENTENLYIEGDNLEVLKLLQESYLNSIKMIYIDPPYNTGNDFIYRDKFRMDKDEYEEQIGLYDENENMMFKNTDTNGRFHSDWCSMMYPRLKLAQSLLSEDGVIFISIDYHEMNNLKKICDEIYGELNFIGEIVCHTATDNNPTQISMEHEYLVCYAKNKLILNKWVTKSDKAEKIISKYKELKGKYGDNLQVIQDELKLWINKNKNKLQGVSHYSYVDEKGVFYPGNSSNTRDGGYRFDIIHPITKRVCKKPDFGYRWTEDTFWNANQNGDVMWGIDENIIPKIKKRIETVTDMLKSYYYEDNRYWTKYLTNLMDGKVFDNPKSVNLLKRIIKFTTSNHDIILDFFSGSATTAQAVMEQNLDDNSFRKCISVQLPEDLNKSLLYADIKAKPVIKNAIKLLDTLNLPRLLSEIGKERLRRVGEKLAKDNIEHEFINSLDIGFRVFKVDSTNMRDVYYSASEYTQEKIADLVSNIKEDRTDLDLLYGVMLDWGLQLSLKHEINKIDGATVHIVDKGSLVACFEDNVSESVIREIAKLQPLRVVFRDSCFEGSPEKINVEEIFKLIAPNTTIRVI